MKYERDEFGDPLHPPANFTNRVSAKVRPATYENLIKQAELRKRSVAFLLRELLEEVYGK